MRKTTKKSAKGKSKAQVAAAYRKAAEEKEKSVVAKEVIKDNEPVLPKREFRMIRLGEITGAVPNIRAYKGMDITSAIDPGLPELSESIKAQGVIEPIVVHSVIGDYGREEFCLIAGFRRLAASRMAGIDMIPACIYTTGLTGKQIAEIQISENIHRCDLKPTEEAAIYSVMVKSMGRTQEEIAARVGKSVKHVSRYLRLLTLPEEIRGKIDGGGMSLAKANVLLSLSKENLDGVLKNYDYLLDDNYNAKEFETEVHRRFYRELSGKIGFDIDKTYTRRVRGATEEYPPCSACPHRRQLELFEEYVTDTVCPNVGCFETKKYIVFEAAEKAKQEAEREREKKRAAGEDVPETAKERNARKSREEWEARSAAYKAEQEEEAKIEAKAGLERADPLVFRKFEVGFSGRDYFVLHGEDDLAMYMDVHTETLNGLYKSYIGKDIDELKSSGSLEEIFKASVIKRIYTRVYDLDGGDDYLDDDIKMLLGMEVEEDKEDEEEGEEEDADDDSEKSVDLMDADGINDYKEEDEEDAESGEGEDEGRPDF